MAQAFWQGVGGGQSEDVFWLNHKGYSGGPNLGKILGSHIGERLRLGEGYLPDFTCELMRKVEEKEGDDIMAFHTALDCAAIFADMVQKRNQFMTKWVSQLSPVAVIAITMMEAQRVSDKMQKRIKKIQKYKAEAEATPSTTDLTAVYTKMGMDMAMGKITMDEYQVGLCRISNPSN